MGRFDLSEAGNLIRRLVSGGMDEQTAAIVARGARTGVPQGLPGDGLVRPPVADPDTARFLDTLSYREAAGLVPPLAPVRSADMSLGSPMFDDMARAADAMSPGRMRQRANVIPGGRRGSPNPAGDLKRIAAQNIDDARAASEAARRPSRGRGAVRAAGAAGAAAGLGLMVTPTPLTESGNPADLRDDPVPAGRDFIDDTLMGMDADDLMQPIAEPEPPAPPEPPEPVDYSLEARKLIDQLNAMRRRAGGEVREAPAMMREINRLLAMGDKQRNTPGYKIPQADPARDPYQQARDLIDQVNAMYRQGARPGDPRIQQMMAKVRQLHSQGDAIRNQGLR